MPRLHAPVYMPPCPADDARGQRDRLHFLGNVGRAYAADQSNPNCRGTLLPSGTGQLDLSLFLPPFRPVR